MNMNLASSWPLCGASAFVFPPFNPTPKSGVIRIARSPPAGFAVLPSARRAEVGDGRADEDNPNLLRVTPAPTYKEMLAWAEETDKLIAAGERPPLGANRARKVPPGQRGSLLTDREQAQMATVSELLSKRRRGGPPLSNEEQATLRAAMDGLSASVDQSDDFNVSSTPEGGMTAAGDGSDGGAPEGGEAKGSGEDFAANPIYGSREVRDKVYLYAWSLLKRNQEAAGTDDQ